MATRLPRYERVSDYPKIRIGRPKHLLMMTLARFGYLSAEQLTALLYSPSSLGFVREHLKELFHAEYVKRKFIANPVPYGSPLAIHVLDSKGGKHTDSAPPDTDVGITFLEHTLAANQLIVLSRLLKREDPASELVAYQTERELKRMAGSAVIPDGWVHISRLWPGKATSNQHYIGWELDRGTIQQRAFRKKLRALVSWVEDDYARQFGVTGLTIAFVVESGPPRRLEQIIRWTEEELENSPLGHYSSLFLFARFDPAAVTPTRTFHEPIWRVPFGDQVVPLLEPPGS